MEISIYSTIDFSKARNLLTERQRDVKAFNPIVPQGGCISILELSPLQYISILWYFINQKTGKITSTTAQSSDSMHYVAIPEGLRLGTYRLKVVTSRTVNGNLIISTTISNPFEYVEASEDVVTIVSRNADNNLVGNLQKNATVIQPIYVNPSSGGGIPEAASRTTAKLMKTGQTTSYRTGDDGDIEAGRGVDFLTLAEVPKDNNGNAVLNTTTNRFTDSLGGQTYVNGIVLDWSTWNGSTVLGCQNNLVIGGGYISLADTIAYCDTLNIDGYVGWRIPNFNELLNFAMKKVQCFNYPPFNYNGINLWWSNTFVSPTNAITLRSDYFWIRDVAITGSNGRPFPVRDFTVTGTTLT